MKKIVKYFAGTAGLSQTFQAALAWLAIHHPELFVDARGKPMGELDYQAVEWLRGNAGLTVGQTLYLNREYMEAANVANMVWLLSHELQHAQLGFWGNLWKMVRPGAHAKLDADVSHPVMLEYIAQGIETSGAAG